jgi:hypothetical protein
MCRRRDISLLAYLILTLTSFAITRAFVHDQRIGRRQPCSLGRKTSASKQIHDLPLCDSVAATRELSFRLKLARASEPLGRGSDDASSFALPPSRKTISRAGGRKARQKKPEQKRPGALQLLILSALAILLSFSQFGGDNPSYVYYQSSVFESTVVGSDGRIETSRKESFKSNLPNLVRQQIGKARGQGGTLMILERDLEQELARDIDTILDEQQRLLKDDILIPF